MLFELISSMFCFCSGVSVWFSVNWCLGLSSGWIDSGIIGMLVCGCSSCSGIYVLWLRLCCGLSVIGRLVVVMWLVIFLVSVGLFGVGYCSLNSVCGKLLKLWIVGGCGCVLISGC